MAEQQGNAKAKKQLLIREIPTDDWEALERERLRLGLKREPFGRLLLHVAIWGAPKLFERALDDALGTERPIDPALLDEPD